MDQNLLLRMLPLVLLIVVMYFLLIRPQRKKEKELKLMRSSLMPGDSIVTIGGIHGKVVKIKDDSIVIQVGADKVKMEMAKWAVSQVITSKANKQKKEEVANSKKPRKANVIKDDVLDAEIEEIKEIKEIDDLAKEDIRAEINARDSRI